MEINKIMIKISDNENGIIVLKNDVFTSIAFISVQEESGVHLDKGTFKKSVTCKIKEDRITLSIELKIHYGSNVQKTCKNVQNRVFKAIQAMTDIKCDVIDVSVIGFNFNAQ